MGLYITNSVQEEVGLRGAEMITQTIKPNVAIVTDVCHDTSTPMINQKIEGQTEIGKGPVISYAPAIQNLLRERIIDTAEANKIPFPAPCIIKGYRNRHRCLCLQQWRCCFGINFTALTLYAHYR